MLSFCVLRAICVCICHKTTYANTIKLPTCMHDIVQVVQGFSSIRLEQQKKLFVFLASLWSRILRFEFSDRVGSFAKRVAVVRLPIPPCTTTVLSPWISGAIRRLLGKRY